jgi:hypothetical protein
MAFTGLASNERFTASQVREDISRIIATLSPKETPFLDWLGDGDVFATSTKHEFFEDHMLPNYIIASSAINSATAATGITVNGLGLALTVGTLLENETDTTNSTREVMQVTSVVGANSILVSRQYGGSAVGSLAAGGQLYVRAMAGVEGQDHDGSSVRRLGSRRANTVGMFYVPVAASGTDLAINLAGNDSYDNVIRKGLIDVLHQLEKEVVRGVLNSSNSLASTTTTRTMQGIRAQLTTINSTTVATTMASGAGCHWVIGNLFEQIYAQGGSPDTETWGIVAGSTFFRNISDLNDTKVQDSNAKEEFKRVIRRYVGPLGAADVILSRVLPSSELLIVPRERLKVVPLQGRSFTYEDLGKTGDNVKGQIVGEYTLELFHEKAMARVRV